MPDSTATPRPDFRTVFQAQPTACLLLAPDLTIAAVSDAYLGVCKHAREDLVGEVIFDVFPDNPADPAASGVKNLRASLERVLAFGLPDILERQQYDVQFPDGADGRFEERVWRAVNTPVLDDDGAVAWIIHQVEDVTEQARATVAHGRAEDALATTTVGRKIVLDSVSEGVVILDRDFRIVEINREGVRIDGRSEADLLGRTHWDVWPASVGTRVETDYRRAMRDRVSANLEHRYVGEGHDKWLELRAYPCPEGLTVLFRDVTDRKRAEERLRESEERLRLEREFLNVVIRQAPVGISISEAPTGRALVLNDKAVELLGHGQLRSDADRFRDYRAMHADGRPYTVGDYPTTRAIRHGEIVDDEEMVYRRGGGQTTRFAVSSAPVWNAGGGIVAAVTVFRDIDERLRMEEALRAGETRMRDILESISDAFYALDREMRITHANERALASWGKRADEILGKPFTAVFPSVVGTPPWAMHEEVQANHRPIHRELVSAISGRWLFVDVYPSASGGLTVFFRDITERKQAEAELRAAHGRTVEILESISDAFYAVDADWRFTYVNRKAEEWWGRRREDLLGKMYWEEFPQAVGSVPYEAHLRAARERQPVQVDAVSPILGHWVDVSIYPSTGGGLSVYFRDVTERKRSEEALRAAKEEAERANLAKSKFLAAASHDLRQPMQSLLLFLDVLKPHVAAKGREALTHLGRGLDALKDLLDSLLDISRLDAGVVQTTVGNFAVGDVIEQIGASYGPIAAAKGLEFRADQCQTIVRSDRTLLGRMVRNLVENALRYTETGHIAIQCHAADGHLCVEIHDTGIGIPPDHLEWIWEEFHQVGNPGRDRNRGLGLGLAIVRRLSSLLGHSVQVRSTPGEGSVFSIELPLGEATPAQAATTVADVEGNGRFAVLVDDDAIVLLGLAATFESWGYDVLAAGSADQALVQLRERRRRPDVVIADFRLSEGRAGTEAIVRIRKEYGADVPGIILTGETGADVQRDAAVHGFAIIHKPVTPRQLGAALERFLSKR